MRFRHPAADSGAKLVVVVGSGFAGLNVSKRLCCDKNLFVILVDQRNYHLFQPLLYQVATAGLNSGDIAVPIRAQFRPKDRVQVHMGKVTSVNLKERFVRVGSEEQGVEIEYDYLVLACGARHSYFGSDHWEEYAPGLKTLEQAKEIRRRTLLSFERAENELDPAERDALMSFAVVGGGPTGVELAGAIADISRTVLVDDFKRIDPSKAKVYLIEAGPRLLAPFAEDLSERTRRDLTDLGVIVKLNSRVEHIDESGVLISGESISARSVFWAAGVQAAQVPIHPTVATDRAGRVQVEPDFSVPSYPEVFVTGDMAALTLEDGTPLPGLAPAAIQGGRHVAKMISALSKGRPTTPFKYRDKGQLATIGRNKAVMQSGFVKITGRLAWLAWLFVHVFYLVGFKNRLSVMYTWAWSYLRNKRGSRLIDESDWRNSAD